MINWVNIDINVYAQFLRQYVNVNLAVELLLILIYNVIHWIVI